MQIISLAGAVPFNDLYAGNVHPSERSGAVTLVERRGALASLEAVGYQDLETKKPMRTDPSSASHP